MKRKNKNKINWKFWTKWFTVQLKENKYFELQLDWMPTYGWMFDFGVESSRERPIKIYLTIGGLLDIDFDWSRFRDHAGVHLWINLFGVYLGLNI